MFGNSGKKDSTVKKTSTPSSSTHAINTLVIGTFVEGDVKAENDFRIDGKLVGNLVCSGKVIIGPEGLIEGSVQCENALIEGMVKGDIVVKDLLTVMDSGNIVGNIKTDRLIVHAGAKFNVNCDMDGISKKEVSQKKNIKNAEQESKGLVFDA